MTPCTVDGSRCPQSPECCPRSTGTAVRHQLECLSAITGIPTVTLTVPKGSNTGAVLRLKGKGVPRRGGHGDELVKLKVMLPPERNPELEAFLTTWAPGTSYDPRRDMQP